MSAPFDPTTGAGRLELERGLRERGDAGSLHVAAVHNVRLHVGAGERYGREDWVALETRRYAEWGPRTLHRPFAVEAPLGSALVLVGATWRLGATTADPRVGVLALAHGGRIVREWQYVERGALGAPDAALRPGPLARSGRVPASPGDGDLPGSSGRDGHAPGPIAAGADLRASHAIAMEYGELRAAPGQQAPGPGAAAVAPRSLAAHPLVVWWHRRWNARDADATREGFVADATLDAPGSPGPLAAREHAAALCARLLAPFDEPVMFCERLATAADGASAVLQWRLVGRHVAPAWGLGATRARLALPGLTFLELADGRVLAERHCFDEVGLAEQALARAG